MATKDARVLFSSGLSTAFSSLTKNENTLYFLTDTQELYLGANRYGFGKDYTVTTSGSGDVVTGISWDASTHVLTVTLGSASDLVASAITAALIAAVEDSNVLTADSNGNIDLVVATGADAGNVTLTKSANGLKADVTIPQATVTGVKSGENVIGLDGTELTSTLSINTAQHDSKTWVQLKGIGGALVSEFDAAAFIKDGMLDSVALEDGTGTYAGKKVLHFVFNTDAGKQDIYVDVSDLIDIYTAASGGGLALDSNNAFSIDNTVTAGTAVQAATLAYGSATNVTVAAYDAHGLVTGTQTVAITLPALPTGTVGANDDSKVVTYANLTAAGLSGRTLNISDTAPASNPSTEEIASTKAVYAAMAKWDTFGA